MSARTVSNRVFYFTGSRKFEIVTEDCPPPGPGEVRCRTICSMISIGTEMTCYLRQVEQGTGWDAWIQYPFPPGYLTVGEVADLGEGVTGLEIGQRVCCTVEHRQWFLAEPARLFQVPDGVQDEQAAWFWLNVIVQNGIREVGPELGETSAVIGLGPLGQLAVRLLGLTGQRHLVGIDPLGPRCELARGHGPTVLLDCPAEQAVDKVKDLTDGRGAENVFDITGHPSAFHAAQRMLGRRGRLGLIGDVPNPSAQTLTHEVMRQSIAIIGTHSIVPVPEGNPYYRWGQREMVELFFHMILAGRIDLDNLISHRITPDDAGLVYNDLLTNRGQYMGIIILWRG